MRRGYLLEKEIDRFLKYVDSIGGHGHKHYPNRTIGGQFISGEPFDYEIFYNNQVICFDAKECKSKSWRPVSKDLKQANNLIKCKKQGSKAYFLVYFYQYKSLIKFDPDLLKSHKSLDPAKGTKLNNITELL